MLRIPISLVHCNLITSGLSVYGPKFSDGAHPRGPGWGVVISTVTSLRQRLEFLWRLRLPKAQRLRRVAAALRLPSAASGLSARRVELRPVPTAFRSIEPGPRKAPHLEAGAEGRRSSGCRSTWVFP